MPYANPGIAHANTAGDNTCRADGSKARCSAVTSATHATVAR